MSGFQRAALDLALDIGGTYTINQAKLMADEATGLGQEVSGQTGAAASITAFGSGVSTLTGLTGMSVADVGNFLTISGAATSANNGTFLIVAFISATSVQIANAAGVAPDGNNGAISWTERQPYSAEDDVNFARTDRKAIKGTTNAWDAIPTYQRPTAVGTNVPKNLTNLVSLDSIARSVTRGQFNWAVEVTLTDIYGGGSLKHADSVDTTGVPVFDSAPFTSDWNSCYVEVTDATTGNELEVLTGLHAGEKIFGITYNGSSTSPNSVEIHWYSAPNGADISTSSTAYSWEQGAATAKTGTTAVTVVAGSNGSSAITGLTAGGFTNADVGTWLTFSGLSNSANNGTFVIISVQSGTAVTVQNHAAVSEGPTASVTWTQHSKTVATLVNLAYGFNQRLDQLDQNAFRFPLATGLTSDADLRQDVNDIQATIGEADGATSLAGLLTNTGPNYLFNNLGTATPSVVQALNTLNAQVGDRTYTGTILTSGQTIAASLQALSNAVTATTVLRTIERLAADVNPNVSHLLPGGLTYVLDGTNNAKYLWVFWNGLLRHPGTLAAFAGNEYAETDTTHITPYTKVKAGSIIDYITV